MTTKDLHNQFCVRTTLYAVLAFGVLLGGCENNFDPINTDNQYNYTIYGVLDLAADTQWVRVMPLRTNIFRDSVPNNAEVSLVRESDGFRIPMQDSLFQLGQNSYVWNFYTDVPMVANESYTLEARSPEGEITSAKATIPEDFEDPVIYYSERLERCFVEVPLQDNIPVATIEFTFQVDFESGLSDVIRYPISYANSLEEIFGGYYQFSVDAIPQITNEFNITESMIVDLKGELLVVSADSNWYELDLLGAELPGVSSNVQNGLGVVTGIVSKRIPFLPNIAGQETLTFCPPF